MISKAEEREMCREANEREIRKLRGPEPGYPDPDSTTPKQCLDEWVNDLDNPGADPSWREQMAARVIREFQRHLFLCPCRDSPTYARIFKVLQERP